MCSSGLNHRNPSEMADDEIKQRRERGKISQRAFRQRQIDTTRELREENGKLRAAIASISGAASQGNVALHIAMAAACEAAGVHDEFSSIVDFMGIPPVDCGSIPRASEIVYHFSGQAKAAQGPDAAQTLTQFTNAEKSQWHTNKSPKAVQSLFMNWDRDLQPQSELIDLSIDPSTQPHPEPIHPVSFTTSMLIQTPSPR
ncbi:uncharacterized protein BCR38DRAFT_502175 [Pseudomassariella vexata]|uniref:BZIP domain-containing protein n=1 Tax=Pseudomassariella vexata TaxID=1141098 RepID=A0A1Y2DFX4_9PEZI|nr:uncharacterized protein BCR38DRAFT_502175 [Pseudomassariella vexata]ORY57595.1 hypothetical protein BCR38DRAFT_502175 [Pseudomassariella vexata]